MKKESGPAGVYKMTGGGKGSKVLDSISYTDKRHIIPDTVCGDYLTLARQIKAQPRMNSTTEPRKVHEGRNLKRIREILQVKQSTLASELGGEWNQKKVSQLEDRETIEPDLLEEIAQALKVPVEAIKNFDEQATICNIQNNYEGSNNYGANIGYVYNFNPFEKWAEAIEKNEKLYERLLQVEKEKMEILERIINEMK